jgi:hypothetical protein
MKVLSLTFPIISNLCNVGINKFVVLSFWYDMQALYMETKKIEILLEFRTAIWTVKIQSWMHLVICDGFSPILESADVTNNPRIIFVVDHAS